MTKSAVTIILGFLVVFAAGGVVGKALTRGHTADATSGDRVPVVDNNPRPDQRRETGGGGRGFLNKELKLTPEQGEQMKRIWQAAMPSPDKIAERRAALQKERDEAIQALLSDEQRVKFEQVNKHYQQQQEELRRERTLAFETAVAETRKILTDEQRQKYDEFRKRWDAERNERGEHGGPGGDRRRGGGPPPPEGRPDNDSANRGAATRPTPIQ
jgi:Spy/CpxP family protein refolding chaperone